MLENLFYKIREMLQGENRFKFGVGLSAVIITVLVIAFFLFETYAAEQDAKVTKNPLLPGAQGKLTTSTTIRITSKSVPYIVLPTGQAYTPTQLAQTYTWEKSGLTEDTYYQIGYLGSQLNRARFTGNGREQFPGMWNSAMVRDFVTDYSEDFSTAMRSSDPAYIRSIVFWHGINSSGRTVAQGRSVTYFRQGPGGWIPVRAEDVPSTFRSSDPEVSGTYIYA